MMPGHGNEKCNKKKKQGGFSDLMCRDLNTKDNITEAIHGLDIFTKNWCLNCKETEGKANLRFRCEECPFNVRDECLIKKFAHSHKGNLDLSDFGAMR